MKEIWLNSFNNLNVISLLKWLLIPITATAALSPAPPSVSHVPLLGEEAPYVQEYPVVNQEALQALSLQETANVPPETDKQLLARYFSPTVALKMYELATCESHNRQSVDGKVVTSSTHDYGYLQINQATWDDKAKELGLDYKGSLEDNIRMAKVVYEAQSFQGWSCYAIISRS
jgi:hypothetical protein